MLIRSALVAVLLAAVATSQLPVNLTGRIEAAPTGACDPAATHKVACTDILLRSDTVDLSALEGSMVDITGTNEGLLCTTVVVTGAVAAPASTTTFSLGGYRLNSTVIFTTRAPVGAVVLYFFSAEPFFLPVLTFGTLQLNPLAGFVYWTADVSIGVAIRVQRLPDDPALVGITALFQTAYVSVAPQLEAKLLNAGCFTIRQ